MTANFAELLTPRNSGVYLAPSNPEAMRKAANEADLAWFSVDLERVTNKKDLMAACSQALGFPRTFGNNWDGLADCLQDFSWRAAPGYVIHLMQAAETARAAPRDFQLLLEILSDAARYWEKQGVVFMALVDYQASGLPSL